METSGHGICGEALCRCGHRASDHNANAIGIGACEFWATGECAGLDSRGWPHCDRFLSADEPDTFRAQHWLIRNARTARPAIREVARLRQAFDQIASGAERERVRPTILALERRARAA